MTDLQMEEFGVRTTPPPHLKIKTLNLHRKKKISLPPSGKNLEMRAILSDYKVIKIGYRSCNNRNTNGNTHVAIYNFA